MGQAKRRGTFEQRKAAAIEHRRELIAKLDAMADVEYAKRKAERGLARQISPLAVIAAMHTGLGDRGKYI